MEIRAKEATVQITVDGQRLGGSMLTISDLNIKPDAEITKKRHTGDKRAHGDLDVKGYDGSFKTEKTDHTWLTLWKLFESADRNGVAFPVVSIAITYAYRNNGRQLRTITLHDGLILKLDEDATPAEGYLTNSWSFFCSQLT